MKNKRREFLKKSFLGTAGIPDNFRSYTPPKEHCYDQDIREEALAWFNKHLKV